MQRVGEKEEEEGGETEKLKEPTQGLPAYRMWQQAWGLHAPEGLSLSSAEPRASSPISCMVLCVRDATVVCLSFLCPV